MDQNEMVVLFSGILDKLGEISKKMDVLVNALANHSDKLVQNTEAMRNLEKVNAATGSVLAQGLSANANGVAWKEALGIIGKTLLK